MRPELWPPYAVVITEHDLRLTVVTDDIPDLVDIALGGIHDPDAMPFAMPWTLAEPSALPADMIRYFSAVRATFRPDKFDLLFAVRVAGTLVGIQALHTTNFAIVRTGETGRGWVGVTRAEASAPGCDVRCAPSRSISSARLR